MTNYSTPVAGQPDSGTSSAAESAKDQAGRVASTAVDHAQQVAGTASEQAAAVTQHATQQARNIVGDAKTQAQEQARRQTGQLADALERWRDQAQALVDGRPEEAGSVGDLARQATERLTSLAEEVRGRGFDGIVDDVQRFARRRPGAFLLGATAFGFLAGRLVRSGALSAASGQQGGTSATSGAPAALPTPSADRVSGIAPAAQRPGLPSSQPPPLPQTPPLPHGETPWEGTTGAEEYRR